MFLSRFPLVLGPVFTEPAIPARFEIGGPDEHARVTSAMRLCTATSFVGLPAVAVPTGGTRALPRGVQIIATFFREDLCLDAAAAIQARLGGLTPMDPVCDYAPPNEGARPTGSNR